MMAHPDCWKVNIRRRLHRQSTTGERQDPDPTGDLPPWPLPASYGDHASDRVARGGGTVHQQGTERCRCRECIGRL